MIALIVPPLPAPSRPSKTMQTLRPLCTHPLLQLDQLDVQLARAPSSYSLPLELAGLLDVGTHEVSFMRITFPRPVQCHHEGEQEPQVVSLCQVGLRLAAAKKASANNASAGGSGTIRISNELNVE